ncbi:het domain protein [Colletotrichum kahawae]|uniref:Het domain protein n=1 Tax=Colletotrichum kahawae TaxID=34407 RepID=A0AAE0D124_COLKA|nr:het domain protein [Colletotrichum kahawae]
MWLINTTTLRLEEILDYSAVEYAILSHTWGDDEVSFKDMQDFTRAKKQAGFVKIATTCELALKEGLQYAWVDTCCIEKTSSAELSEAINAMFVWYQASAVCFVWLEDLAPSSSASKTTPTGRKLRDISKMASCKWFSRGWTLQELIAPTDIRFYDSDWNFRFTKEDNVLALSTITTIDIDVLKMAKRLKDVLVAVKMSWAANRETTRPEDVAYCLLGIFDINMPMLYGEGEKAFQRLQEQIGYQQQDASMFAWLAPFRPPLAVQTFRGVFATSPQQFASSGQIRKVSATRPEFALENWGVKLTTTGRLSPIGMHHELSLHLECLACNIPHEIYIAVVATSKGFVRILSESCLRTQGAHDDHHTPEQSLVTSSHCRRVVDQEESEALEAFVSKPIKIRLKVGRAHQTAYPGGLFDLTTYSFCGGALSEDFFGLFWLAPEALKPLHLTLGIKKMVDEEIGLRFYYADPANSHWGIVGGSKKEDILNEDVIMVGNDLSRQCKAGISSHLYKQKASVWYEDPGAPEGEINNAKVKAIANGLEITISMSMWSSGAGEIEMTSIYGRNEGTVFHDDGSSRERKPPSPEPDDERKPRRFKRPKLKK